MFIRVTAALAASCCLLGTAQANQIGHQLTVQCTGSLGIMGMDGLSMRCEGGDLSLHGASDDIGLLSSDVGIDLFATGRLDLQRVTLNAPLIRLSGQDVSIGDQAILGATGSVAINAGGTSSSGLTMSPRADVHRWDSFDIGAAGSVVVNSGAGNTDLTVFRVLPSHGSSTLHGTLHSAGEIVIVTRNDIDPTALDAGWITVASGMSTVPATLTAVPEPSALGLFGVGLLGILAARRPGRKRC